MSRAEEAAAKALSEVPHGEWQSGDAAYLRGFLAGWNARGKLDAQVVEAYLKDYRRGYAEDLCPSSMDIEDISPSDRTRTSFRMGRFILDNCSEQLPAEIRALAAPSAAEEGEKI